ncbi:hypothetical protein SPI_06992 [Niveomyces insectorum RCEF 264]|uniref:Uncharacterized protein n=1 Tax=Niveomyces insectorum RCEF 264 TaxID=1081102 RepID=A0A167QYT2_9HYPO|nr:hypothetical protein SPI_06992 [Niveomyces insectorum RCEF 264]
MPPRRRPAAYVELRPNNPPPQAFVAPPPVPSGPLVAVGAFPHIRYYEDEIRQALYEQGRDIVVARMALNLLSIVTNNPGVYSVQDPSQLDYSVLGPQFVNPGINWTPYLEYRSLVLAQVRLPLSPFTFVIQAPANQNPAGPPAIAGPSGPGLGSGNAAAPAGASGASGAAGAVAAGRAALAVPAAPAPAPAPPAPLFAPAALVARAPPVAPTAPAPPAAPAASAAPAAGAAPADGNDGRAGGQDPFGGPITRNRERQREAVMESMADTASRAVPRGGHRRWPDRNVHRMQLRGLANSERRKRGQ